MSGDIFQREPDPIPENLDDVDVIGRNPLMCYLCNGKYDDPCILGCYHSFCSTCLRGRGTDGKMLCPLCKEKTALKEGENLPSKDKLLQFLVMSSSEEREQCANCDKEEDQMFFCNTCAQPLCERCREETHRAKMFTRHDIVVLSKRTKEIHRECSLHNEPFILFSTEKKMMLCINCFRDMKIESRSYCVDMETAYHQSCKKLDQRMQAIRDLQNSVQDSILLLRALLEEITQNSELEKSAIKELYNSMLKEITDKKETLLMEVDRQYQDKQKLFTEELANLSTLLPTLHTHLVISAAFSSSANKFEFLDLAYILMERLKSIIHLKYPLHPSQGSQIYTDFKSQIAKCLEPLLFPQRLSSVLSSTAAGSLSLSASVSTSPRLEKKNLSVPQVRSGTLTQNERRQVALNKLKLTEGKGMFADHCHDFDNSHKSLSQMVERLKSHLQELQRDLTLRRCLTKQTVMEELQAKVEQVEQQLEDHKIKVEQKQPMLEKYWEECVQRITCEQEVYQAQLQDVMRIHQETSHLRTILNQLSRFVTSITALTERLAPKLATSAKESNHDNQIAAIFEQINTLEPDSQHRVEALRTAAEERETLSASRTNPMDEELIKTKGLLKAPSARRDGNQRRDFTKRESREAKGDSLSKDSTLIEYLTELETGAKLSFGEKSKVDGNISVVTSSSCEDSVPLETQVHGLQDSVKVSPKSEVKGDFDISKTQHSGKETLSNTELKMDEEKSDGCVDMSVEFVLPLKPEIPASVSESSQAKPHIQDDPVLLVQNNGANGRPLSPKINFLTDDKSALNNSGDKLGSKPCSSVKGANCDTLSTPYLHGGHLSPGGSNITSQTLSDSSVSAVESPNSDTLLCLPVSPSSDSRCGTVSPVSDAQLPGAGSPGETTEVEGQEDDMTGGETLQARIERLKGSIDNGTSVSQMSKSPQDSLAQGSRSPEDNVSQRSRSPREKCSLLNGGSQVVDVGKICVSSCLSNGDVKQEVDSRSGDITGPCEPELKSLTQGRAVGQGSGRRRRRVKADQLGNQGRTRDGGQGSEVNEQVTVVKGQKE